MSKRREDKTRFWVKPPDSAQQPETWRPVGPFTLNEIAKSFDWDCEVLKKGKSFAVMRSSGEWQHLSAICPENPKEVFTDVDFIWREWWKNCAGKKFVPKPKVTTPPPVVSSPTRPITRSSPAFTAPPSVGATGKVHSKPKRNLGTVSPAVAAAAIGVWQRQQMLKELREINETSHDIHHDLSDLNDSMSGSDSDFGGLA